tara:strand:+ start:815 stop:943 length:129 start_codon:yes stop_codon:yes gene_type:complete
VFKAEKLIKEISSARPNYVDIVVNLSSGVISFKNDFIEKNTS